MRKLSNYIVSIKFITIFIMFIMLASVALTSLNNDFLAPNHSMSELSQAPSGDVEPEPATSNVLQAAATRARPRPNYIEVEPNDNPQDPDVVDIKHNPLDTLFGVEISGSVCTVDEQDFDWFKIKLGADYTPGAERADNLSLLLTDLTSQTGKTSGEIYVKIYAVYDIDQNGTIEYDRELILMCVERYELTGVWDRTWGFAHYDRSIIDPKIYYYICIEGAPIFGDTLDYTIQVNVSDPLPIDPSLTEDFDKELSPNNDIAWATDLVFSQAKNRSIHMAEDTIDWYVIEAPTTNESIGTNFSFRLSVVNSYPNNVDNGVHYLSEVIVLIEYETKTAENTTLTWNPAILRASLNSIDEDGQKYLTPNVNYAEITNATKISIGIYVQSYGIVGIDSADYKYYDNNQLTHGWAQYVIKSWTGKTIIPPKISDVNVISLRTGNWYGRTYDIFKYGLTYTDRNNDLPTVMKITIDGEYTTDLVQTNPTDFNLRDGTEYEFFMDGTILYDLNGTDHTYTLHIKDLESYAPDTWENGNIIYHGPYILNNIPPYVRPTAPSRVYIYEDGPPKYQDLNKIFEDIDTGDELLFSVYEENTTNWTTNFENEDLIVNVLDNDNLKLIPKPNQHGNIILKLNASDTKNHIVSITNLEVTIISVNDPPKIKTPFSKLYFLGELHIPEDGESETFNITDVFWDPIENDPLKFTFSGNEEVKIRIFTNGTTEISPKSNWSGTEKVTFYASDGQASVSDILTVVIDKKNDPPILNHTPSKRVYENHWCNFTLSAYDTDPGDSITFGTDLREQIYQLNDDHYSFDRYTGSVSFFPTYKSIKSLPYLVTFSVTDSHDATVSEEVEIEVMNIEDPPVPYITSPNDGYVTIPNDKTTFIGGATDPDLKIPGTEETLTLRWRSNIDRLLGDQPILPDIILSQGEHKITLEVSDGRYTRSVSITVKVVEDIHLDSDNDGIPDWWEDRYYLVMDPRDPHDADDDPDRDSYTNLDEYKLGTDPTDDGSPVGNETLEEEEEGLDTEYMNFIIIIIIVIFIVGIGMMMYRNKLRHAEATAAATAAKKDEELAAARAKAEAKKSKKYGKYQPKFNERDVLCFQCGRRLEVSSVVRPLAVTCNQCNTKSIIYDR